jgi:type I restriction enzyme S subunit
MRNEDVDAANKGGGLTPQLRFPDFRNAKGWVVFKLSNLSQFVTEKVGSTICTPYTVTSGVGLVSQKEKLGRTIAGNSLKNYIILQRNDFAYNKSATKAYPQGFIALYDGDDRAAVPNSIFVCFRINENLVIPAFLDALFHTNLHGKWLRNRIAVGARAHGSLQVSDGDLMALPVPLPSGSQSLAEQQKIADCLSSIDELISAEARKLDALKAHKKGLMQQLFPAEGETVPRLRFPEFHEAEDWKNKSLGKVFETTSGGTPNRSKEGYWGGDIPWITTSLIDFGVIYEANEYITKDGLNNSSAKIFPVGTVLVAMYGQGKTRGKVAILGIEAATNQACAAIIPSEVVEPFFVFLSMGNRYDEIRELSNSGGQENLSQGLIREISFSFPGDVAEQKKIVDFFSSLNDAITNQDQKIENLKSHKKGLMQQLFPIMDELQE